MIAFTMAILCSGPLLISDMPPPTNPSYSNNWGIIDVVLNPLPCFCSEYYSCGIRDKGGVRTWIDRDMGSHERHLHTGKRNISFFRTGDIGE